LNPLIKKTEKGVDLYISGSQGISARFGEIINIIIFVLLITPIISMAHGLKIGTNVPFFRVKSVDDKELTSDRIKGKVVVIFYETKDSVEKNRKLKDELNKFYDEQPDAIKEQIVRVPIINCSGAFWPFAGIWKRKLREHSKKEGITIYGDWDGMMSSDYSMKSSDSNIVIIGKKGRIRYFAFGKVENERISSIKKLLKELVNE